MTMESLKYNFIVIEGNIGSGKTSLASRLAEVRNSRLILEEFADNPFLPQFYADPARFAFPLEMSFLAGRYHQLKDKFSQPELFTTGTVSDYLFIKSLIFSRINLTEDEYELYRKLFYIIDPMLPRPDLLVYLYNTTANLLENIKKRGRSYEQQISGGYLDSIHRSYMEYFRQAAELKILVLDISKIDFVNSMSDFQKIDELLRQDYKTGITTLQLK